MGYHITQIQKGTLGELSKVREEFEEAVDAHCQDNPVMLLLELADMLGAIEAVAAKYNITLADLVRMHEATKRAFTDGTRGPRNAAALEVSAELSQQDADDVKASTGIDVEAELTRLLNEELAKDPGYRARQEQFNRDVVAGLRHTYKRMQVPLDVSRLEVKHETPRPLSKWETNPCCEIPLGDALPCVLGTEEMSEEMLALVKAASVRAKESTQHALTAEEAERILAGLAGIPAAAAKRQEERRLEDISFENFFVTQQNAPITTGVLGALQGVQKRYSAGGLR